jgi:hypothetical protein
MPELIFMKLGMYIMTVEPMWTAYFINHFHPSVSVCVSPIVDRQRLGINITAAMNTHVTIEELLDASFSMRSVSYQRKVGDSFFQELFVLVVFIKLCHIKESTSIEGFGFESLPAVTIKISVFWNITPCSPVKAKRHSTGIYRPHLLPACFKLVSCLAYSSILNVDAICYSETLVDSHLLHVLVCLVTGP